jgi:CBS domain containing-hemolysin-like protein
LKNFKDSLIITILTFILTIIAALLSYSWIESIPFFPAVFILIVIISIGVVSDMVGIAAAAADEKPFHAKAAKKVFGAKKGLFLVKHANRVSNFMCDIVGDICGIISGSLGTIIVIKMANNWQVPESWIDLLILSLIASLTVGGKSFLKNYGIKRANEIILFVGKILASPVFLKNAISKH